MLLVHAAATAIYSPEEDVAETQERLEEYQGDWQEEVEALEATGGERLGGLGY